MAKAFVLVSRGGQVSQKLCRCADGAGVDSQETGTTARGLVGISAAAEASTKI